MCHSQDTGYDRRVRMLHRQSRNGPHVRAIVLQWFDRVLCVLRRLLRRSHACAACRVVKWRAFQSPSLFGHATGRPRDGRIGGSVLRATVRGRVDGRLNEVGVEYRGGIRSRRIIRIGSVLRNCRTTGRARRVCCRWVLNCYECAIRGCSSSCGALVTHGFAVLFYCVARGGDSLAFF